MISQPLIYFLLIALVAAFALYLVVKRGLTTGAVVLLFVSVFPVELAFELEHVQSGKQKAEYEATNELNHIAHRMTGLLGAHLAAAEGLATYIASNPDITQPEFQQFASSIFARHEYLITIAAAPDLTIDMIYPIAGNEAALGLNYRETPSQREAVLRAVDRREAVLAGPVALVQGGVALIGRIPVYTPNAHGESALWGIVSATINAEKIFTAAGLRAQRDGMQISVRGLDGQGELGDVFLGDSAMFSGTHMINNELPVAGGSWLMAATYPELQGLGEGVWFLRIIALLVTFGWLVGLEQRRSERDTASYYQEKVRAGELLLHEAGKVAGVAGWKLDLNGEQVYFSEEFCNITGLPKVEFATSGDIHSGFARADYVTLQRTVGEAFEQANSFDIELPFDRHGEQRWLRIIGNPQIENGTVVALIGAIQDVTERKEFLQTIERQATRDKLTGLPNRKQFDAFLAHELANAERKAQRLAVLFIDLDEFKSVNDNLGHSGGDDLLVVAAQRIQECTRKSDIVARLSGDEFAVILSDIESPNSASVVAAKIVASMNQRFEISGRQIFVSASVGVAMYPEDGESADTLLINADQAMYEVKKSVRNDFTFFTKELQQRSEERHKMFNMLSLAVAEKRLELHYQPIIPLNSSGRIACEALVRWKEDGVYIPPDAFIPLAEDTGLITEIDRFVLQEATDFMTTLQAAGMEPPGLSVNVSPRIFFDRAGELTKWIEQVKACAQRTDLTIEITERLLTQDTPHAMGVLQQLRTEGIKIAIDDFGTGYSSLSYLAKFPIDTLKIDAFFVTRIPQDASAVTLTESIISLGKELSLHLVAEGVETADQLHFLQERGCHSAQGFWMSRPQSAEDFTRWLKSYVAALDGSRQSTALPAMARMITPLDQK